MDELTRLGLTLHKDRQSWFRCQKRLAAIAKEKFADFFFSKSVHFLKYILLKLVLMTRRIMGAGGDPARAT